MVVRDGICAYLAHEVGDNTVERAALEVERLAGFPRALLAGAEATEVLGMYVNGWGGDGAVRKLLGYVRFGFGLWVSLTFVECHTVPQDLAIREATDSPRRS